MKKAFAHLMIFLSISFLTGCIPLVHHANPFYDLNTDDFPLIHLPLIEPIEATQIRSSSPWDLGPFYGLHIEIPKSREEEIQKIYSYNGVEDLEKFAVQDGVIMAYSANVDQEADAYIRNDFFHWFVIVPSKKITKGFHTEDEFRQYIQTIGIQDPVWWKPKDAYHKYSLNGGCIDWIPDCKK
jgi:hypothetical protein